MKKIKLILCSSSISAFQPISDYIEDQGLNFDVISTNSANSAFSAVPKKGSDYIILSDVLIDGETFGGELTVPLLNLIAKSRLENPRGYMILFSLAPDILRPEQLKKFNCVINNGNKDSYYILHKKLKELSPKEI